MSNNFLKYFRWLKVASIIYLIVGVILFFIQDLFLFHPKKVDRNYDYNFTSKYEEEFISFKDEDTIHLVKFYADSVPRKGIVIYYHGNMKNIAHYADFVKPFIKNGYDVWMQDYPGFGKSTGTISENKLYEQGLLIASKANQQIGNDSLIIYGKSIGTGIASYVASKIIAKKLILETPYYSIPSMFATYAFIYPTNYMCHYKLPTYEYLQKVNYSITIFHGTNDGVIPYSNAKKLEKFLNPNDRFITIPKADHHNINTTIQYFYVLNKILND